MGLQPALIYGLYLDCEYAKIGDGISRGWHIDDGFCVTVRWKYHIKQAAQMIEYLSDFAEGNEV